METKKRRQIHNYFAVCPSGAEMALCAELKRLRFGRAQAQTGGGTFNGDASEGWRAALHLRCAVRVYREFGRFPAGDENSLYQGALALPWETLLTPQTTFAVDTRSSNPAIKHTGFAALKIKDAIVDRMRERFGARPSVDVKNPDFRIFAHLGTGRCAISVDIAGRPLSRRGYRLSQVEAPVSETLAAVAIDYSDWDMKAPLIDPMCGSGTLIIEGAMKAAGIAPGLIDPDFSFLRMADFDSARWEAMLAAAKSEVRPPKKLVMQGFDADARAIAASRENANRAGVGEFTSFEVADIENFRPKPGWGAVVVSNPPYGRRIGEPRDTGFFNRVGQILLERCKGYSIHLFLPDALTAKALMLKPDRYRPLFHGGLEVRLYSFTIRARTD